MEIMEIYKLALKDTSNELCNIGVVKQMANIVKDEVMAYHLENNTDNINLIRHNLGEINLRKIRKIGQILNNNKELIKHEK